MSCINLVVNQDDDVGWDKKNPKGLLRPLGFITKTHPSNWGVFTFIQIDQVLGIEHWKITFAALE